MLSTFEIIKMIAMEAPSIYSRVMGINGIDGFMYGFDYHQGTLLILEIHNLPDSQDECAPNVYAAHIHNGESCSGTTEEPFKNADGHFSKVECPHPAHSGDLPSLFSFNGSGWMCVYTGRIQPNDIIGRTIVIHEHSEDFKTQPSGNPGKMIACGEIIKLSNT